MATVKIRNVELGKGMPKVAVPNVGTNEKEILDSAKKIEEEHPDIVEWRIDYYKDGIKDFNKLRSTAEKLRSILDDIPILVTFRTKNEGGVLQLNESSYLDLVKDIIENRLGDAVDLELFHEENKVKDLVDLAHKYNIVVIMSNHDFNNMPSEDVIKSRLKKMLDLGTDVAKFAGMPVTTGDVLNLLAATSEVELETNQPLITMAMGDIGKVSRIAGQIFGSSLSFGTVGKASAPGQLSIKDLRQAEKYLEF